MSGGKAIKAKAKAKAQPLAMPTPMSIHGWTLDSLLAGVGTANQGQGTTLEDAANWRQWDVGGFTGACNVLWAEDARDLLVPSSNWHCVKWLRIATTRLRHAMGWSDCEHAPHHGDNFPAGALAMLEWEAGRPLAVIGGGVHIKAGLPEDLMEVYWEIACKGSGQRLKTMQRLLMAQEGGAA